MGGHDHWSFRLPKREFMAAKRGVALKERICGGLIALLMRGGICHNVAMPNRRSKLLRLLSNIDQGIAEARNLSVHPDLSERERRCAAVQMEFRQHSVKRVVAMLGKLDGGE